MQHKRFIDDFVEKREVGFSPGFARQKVLDTRVLCKVHFFISELLLFFEELDVSHTIHELLADLPRFLDVRLVRIFRLSLLHFLLGLSERDYALQVCVLSGDLLKQPLLQLRFSIFMPLKTLLLRKWRELVVTFHDRAFLV